MSKTKPGFRSMAITASVLVATSVPPAMSQTVVERTKPLAPITSIRFEVAGELEVLPSKTFGYVIRAEPRVIDAIMFSVEQGALRIHAPRGYRSEKPVKIVVQTPALSSFVHDGSGDAKIGAVSCTSFKLIAKGSGNITTDELNCSQIAVNTQGSGDVTLNGKARNLSIETSGAGTLQAENFVASEIQVKQDGSGDVNVNASKLVKGTLAGSGDLNTRGPALVQVSATGAGSVSRR